MCFFSRQSRKRAAKGASSLPGPKPSVTMLEIAQWDYSVIPPSNLKLNLKLYGPQLGADLMDVSFHSNMDRVLGKTKAGRRGGSGRKPPRCKSEQQQKHGFGISVQWIIESRHSPLTVDRHLLTP